MPPQQGPTITMDDEYEALKALIRNESLRRRQSAHSRQSLARHESPARSRSRRRSSASPARSIAMVMNDEYEPVMVFTKKDSFRRRRSSQNDPSSLERFLGARPVKSRSFKTINSKERMTRTRSGKSMQSRDTKRRHSCTTKSRSSRMNGTADIRDPDTIASSWFCGAIRDDAPAGGGCCGPTHVSDDEKDAIEIQKRPSWFCAAPENDGRKEAYNEDGAANSEYLDNIEQSFNSYLDDKDNDSDDEEDEEDELSETTAGESVPSTVFIPNSMVQRIKLRGANLKPKFLRKKKSSKSRRIVSNASSFNNSTLPSKEDTLSYKKEKRRKSKAKLSSPISRLNCAAGGIPDGVDIRDELDDVPYRYSPTREQAAVPTMSQNRSLKWQPYYPEPTSLVNDQRTSCSFIEPRQAPQKQTVNYSDDEIRTDPLCFGLGGDRLICMPEDDNITMPIPQRSVTSKSSLQDKRTQSSLAKIKKRVQRVRSGGSKYLI